MMGVVVINETLLKKSVLTSCDQTPLKSGKSLNKELRDSALQYVMSLWKNFSEFSKEEAQMEFTISCL